MRVHHHQSLLVLASLLSVGAFVGSTAYAQHRLIRLDSLSSTIETNAAPTLEYLGRLGVRLERLRALMLAAVVPNEPSPYQLNAARGELNALNEDIVRYLALTPLPGERALWSSMRRDVERAADSTRLALEAVEGGHRSRAARLLHTRADPALEHASETVLATLRFDVQASEGLAREVRDVRRSATREIAILDVLATIVALGAALIAFRASREHDRLLQRHNALLAERVTDLDRFAGRVAHDILSPLNAVGFALALVARSTDSHSPEHIDRAQRSLLRVKQLVEGLLRFARAGADGNAGSRCRVDVVLTNVAADCQERAKEADITVVVEPCERLEAACTIGVLTSIVQNLVLNAIKYMGDRATRFVTIRARLVGERVRIEVEDTGPGIPAEIRDRMFQPFVRGEQSTDGLGLGLATVQRLVDAHGGTVDVHSTVGVGTVFRIDLPVAKPIDV